MVALLPLLGLWMLSVLTPGPDFVVIVQYATSRSRRHGALVAVGSCSSILLWATGSMLGLSVLLTRLSWLYEIVRLAGAAYLVYLGARTLWSTRRAARRDGGTPAGTDAPPLGRRLVRAGRGGGDRPPPPWTPGCSGRGGSASSPTPPTRRRWRSSAACSGRCSRTTCRPGCAPRSSRRSWRCRWSGT